jgi:iron complex transport system ATP-binding protein
MIKQSVHIEDICFAYDSEMVLKHLSMDIVPNSICFIMGNNGSGKTTLLKNILGFLTPQQGAIEISGKRVTDIDKQTMSRLVSYVPQAIHLSTDFSVIDYISLGRTPHIGLLNQLTDQDYEVIERISVLLGVDEIYEVPFNKLSGGQKQMVAVARSLIQDTPIIILDEPMSALDIGKQVDLLHVLHELKTEGKTIILTTHNPNHALAMKCDVCFLKQGSLIAYGDSMETISEKRLHEIYGNNISLDCGKKQSFVVFNTGFSF